MTRTTRGPTRLRVGLVMLAFLLTITACDSGENGSGEPSASPSISQSTSPTSMPPETYIEVISHELHPCGPSHMPYSEEAQENFLHWTRDGSHLVFKDDDTIRVLGLESSDLRQVADVDLNYQSLVDPRGSGLRFLYGFHADVSPDGYRIVYSTCEYPDNRLIERREGIGVGNTEPRLEALEAYELGTVDVRGQERNRLTQAAGLVNHPSWSPDGKQIAFVAHIGDFSTLPLNQYHYPTSYYQKIAKIALIAADGSESLEGEFRRIGSTGRVALYPPVWSPDGQRLAYLAYEGEEYPFDIALYVVGLDGSALTRIGQATAPATWSPDGKEIAFASLDGETPVIRRVRPGGTGLHTIWRAKPGNAATPISQIVWSPEGSALLFVSGSVYVVGTDGDGLRCLATSWPSTVAAWSPDGAKVAIHRPGREISTMSSNGTDVRMLVQVDFDGRLRITDPSQDQDISAEAGCP